MDRGYRYSNKDYSYKIEVDNWYSNLPNRSAQTKTQHDCTIWGTDRLENPSESAVRVKYEIEPTIGCP